MNYNVLSLGAGVQSTTLYLMQDYDAAVFADTGDEPLAVYRHLEWLKSLAKKTPIITVSRGNLGNDIIAGLNSTGQRFVSIPAFSTDGRTTGKLRRQCTKEYKTQVIDQAIRRQIVGRNRVPRGVTVTVNIGISVEEAGRAARMLKRPLPQWKRFMFPLLERGMTRAECQRWLTAFGVPHEVPKSSCVFCPYHDDTYWQSIKRDDPEGWKRAVEIDEALRQGTFYQRRLDQKVYLHRSCRPLVQIHFSNPQWSLGFHDECDGVCGV